MKKLNELLVSLSSLFLVVTPVISCGTSQKDNETNSLLEMDKAIFEAELSIEGVDGSLLDTENTGEDALQLIKNEILKIDKKIKNINLIDSLEKNNYLQEGDNFLTVVFELASVKYEFPVLVKNVKDVRNLNAKEAEVFLNKVLNNPELLTVGYEDEDLKADQVTRWKNVITKKIERRLENVKINIKVIDSNPLEKKVIVEVDNLPHGIQKKTKEINYTVPIVNSGMNIRSRGGNKLSYEQIVNQINNSKWQGKNFTTHQTVKDALFPIINKIKLMFANNNLDEPIISYENSEVLEKLVEGRNILKFKIAPDDLSFTDDSVSLEFLEVKSALPSYDGIKKAIDEILLPWVDASCLQEGTTFNEAKAFVMTEIGKIPQAQVYHPNYDPDDDYEFLKAGDNYVRVTYNIGNNRVSPNVLLKNVRPTSNLNNVNDIYSKPVKYSQGRNAQTFESMVKEYQSSINSHFTNQNIKASLKNSAQKTTIAKPGFNKIDVVYEQNGKKTSGTINPYVVTPNPQQTQATSDVFAKIIQYANQGIDASQLNGHVSDQNSVYEAFDAVRNFLNKVDPNFQVTIADNMEVLNSKLQQGNNKINTRILKDGKIANFTFTIKNVGAKSPHYVTPENHRNPQDKKLWDVFNLIGSPDLPHNMAGHTKGEIGSVLQKHLDQIKITGVKILTYEPVSVLKQKIEAQNHFPFTVYIQDVVTKRGIKVVLDVYVM